MNKIVNNFLLAGDKFMIEMHLKHPEFTYSTCRLFTKNKERIQRLKWTGDSKYIYKNELDKACFQHDTAYRDFKDLARRTTSDKVLRDKAIHIPKDPKYDGYQRGFASMVYGFFDKKSSGSGIKSIPNKQIADKLHKPIIKKIKRKKYILHLKTIFGILILQICNWWANSTKELGFCYVLLICLVNMCGLFL